MLRGENAAPFDLNCSPLCVWCSRDQTRGGRYREHGLCLSGAEGYCGSGGSDSVGRTRRREEKQGVKKKNEGGKISMLLAGIWVVSWEPFAHRKAPPGRSCRSPRRWAGPPVAPSLRTPLCQRGDGGGWNDLVFPASTRTKKQQHRDNHSMVPDIFFL